MAHVAGKEGGRDREAGDLGGTGGCGAVDDAMEDLRCHLLVVRVGVVEGAMRVSILVSLSFI